VLEVSGITTGADGLAWGLALAEAEGTGEEAVFGGVPELTRTSAIAIANAATMLPVIVQKSVRPRRIGPPRPSCLGLGNLVSSPAIPTGDKSALQAPASPGGFHARRGRSVVGYPVVRLVSRGTATGRMLWADKLATSPAGTQPVLGLAGQAAVQTAGAKTPGKAPLLAYDLGTGRLAWRALMPTFVQAPPVPIPGGLLLQPADPPYACAVAS